MHEIANTILEYLKLAPRYFIAISAITGFLLFGEDEILKKLGVFEFTQNNRSVIGFCLIGSAALFVLALFTEIITFMRKWQFTRKIHQRIIERLNNLAEDEKQILRYYIAKQTRANILRIDDGVVQGLVACGIIFRSASVGNMHEGFAHNISDFAWDYLNVQSHILQGSTNYYRTDKQDRYW
jgi:hypothetical protein